MTRTAHEFNAIAISYDSADKVVSRQPVQVIDGRVYRAAGHVNFWSGTSDFHNMWEAAKHSFVARREIVGAK